MADFNPFGDPEVIDQWIEGQELVLVKDIAIVKAGFQYALSSGPYTATIEDVHDFVASQTDPVVHPPRVWIGHPDDEGRFPRPASGEPALGVFTNIRLNENGTEALGDLATFKWLAKIVPVAFPNRSMEGYTDHETHTGQTWSLVIPDIALLGVSWPGIHCLDDLPIVLSAEGPDDVEITDTTSKEVAVAKIAAAPIQAQMNVEDVNRAAWESWPERSEFYWILGILLDPDEVLCEDANEQIYKVPFTLGENSIEFGEAAPYVIEYVPGEYVKPETVPTEASAAARRSMAIAAAAGDGRAIAAVNNITSREASRPTAKKEGAVSAFMDKLKGKLHLAADATEDDVLDALPEGEGETPVTPDGTATPAVETPEGTTPEGETPEGQTTPAEPTPVAAAQIPEGMVLVDKGTLEKVTADAAAGAAVAASTQKAADETVLAEAIKQGRIAPSRKEHFASLMESDREGTTHLLTASAEDGGLAPDTIPIHMRGVNDQTTAATGSGKSLNGLFPELAKKDGGDS